MIKNKRSIGSSWSKIWTTSTCRFLLTKKIEKVLSTLVWKWIDSISSFKENKFFFFFWNLYTWMSSKWPGEKKYDFRFGRNWWRMMTSFLDHAYLRCSPLSQAANFVLDWPRSQVRGNRHGWFGRFSDLGEWSVGGERCFRCGRAEAEPTRSYGSTVAKLVQPMESKTPGSARKAQESDERWPALTNAQNLSYTLKVNEVKVWSGLSSTWELSTSAHHLPVRSISHRTADAIQMDETKVSLVLPMCWEDGTMWQERCGRTNLLSVSLSRRLPTKLPGTASTALSGDAIKFCESDDNSCPGYGSICLEDGGIDRSANCSGWRTVLSVCRMVSLGIEDWRQYGIREEVLPQCHFGSRFCHTALPWWQLSLLSSVWKLTSTQQWWVRIPSPFQGLYAAGEAAGDHGNNCLGGNCLLNCVVFGRVECAACAKYRVGKQSAGHFPCSTWCCWGFTKWPGHRCWRWFGWNVSNRFGKRWERGAVGQVVVLWGQFNGARTQREKDSADSSDTLKGGAKKPELAKLRKLSSFQCAKRCKSRTLRSAAKRELRGVTLLTSVHSCGCPLGLAAHEAAAAWVSL